MYVPQLNEECQELVDKVASLPVDQFRDVMYCLGFTEMTHEIKRSGERIRQRPTPEMFLLDSGRIEAEYYARMQLAHCTSHVLTAQGIP